MKFQEIEEEEFTGDAMISDMFHKIYQNCQPFLQEIGDPNKFTLYRGIQDTAFTENPYQGIKDVRLDNRLPTDTSQSDHTEINQYFEEAYGHPYRNGLFVTGTALIAENYGDVYAIFPIGKFDYIWHPKIPDLYSEIIQDEAGSDHWRDFASHQIGKENMEALDIREWDNFRDMYSQVDLLSWYIDEQVGPYKTDQLKVGIRKARTEIMIWVKQYYYMHPGYLSQLKSFISK